MIFRNVLALLLLPALGLAAARAQEQGEVPGALSNPGSYQGSMQLQREEQQRDQQVQQQNAAMQQRLDENYRSYAPKGGGMGGGGVRSIDWFAKPPLPPEKNPLLGRWKQTGSRPPKMGGMLGQLSNPFLAGAMAGGCKSIFGSGVIAFEPTALQWVAPDGHEEILNHVGYRAADGNDVVMVTRDPGAIPQLFFGFPNRDHAVVAVFGCTMERLGAKGSVPAPAQHASARSVPQPAPTAQGAGDARLTFQIGAAMPGHFQPFGGVRVWVTREDPENALVRAGVPVQRDLVAQIDGDCHDVAACTRDFKAMTVSALGFITTDANGHAQTPAMKPGRYYLVGVAPYQGRHLFWHRAIDMRSGPATVTLDQTNASMIQ
jgi:hypothetical protein